jgi:hypothetical protein
VTVLEIGLGLAAAAGVVAGGYFGGLRGATIVAALLAVVWAGERISASYDAEAEVERLTAAAARSEAAFRTFREQSGRAAEEAGRKILEQRLAAVAAEADLDAANRRIAETVAELKERIARNVPNRPACDYSQPVLDGLRDAWRAADRRRTRSGAGGAGFGVPAATVQPHHAKARP